jgi:hypothetical protein
MHKNKGNHTNRNQKAWQGDYNHVTSQELSFNLKGTLKKAFSDQNKIGGPISTELELRQNGKQHSRNTTSIKSGNLQIQTNGQRQ